MQLRILLLATLLAGFNASQAQTIRQYFGGYHEYSTTIGSIIETPLFDSNAIQQQQISECYVVKTEIWYAGTRVDTLSIFSFDSLGRITRELRQDYFDRRLWDTIYYPFQRSSLKIITETRQEGSLTYRTDHWLEQFYMDSTVFDTSAIRHRTFDGKGRVLEDKMNVTPDYGRVIFCGKGRVFHYTYQYDEKNRIVFYDDKHYRIKIKYTQHGRMVRLNSSRTGKLILKHFIKTSFNINSITEEDDDIHISFERLSPGSKLFRQFYYYSIGNKTAITYVDFIYQRAPLPETKDWLTVTH